MVWAKRVMTKSEIRKAISEYEKMMTDDSKSVRIRSKLADLYRREHKTDRAIEQYIKVAKHYEDEDLKSRAISVYRKILNLDPKRVVIYHRMARLYRDQALLGNARVLYREIMRLDPKDKSARKAILKIEKTISEKGRPVSDQAFFQHLSYAQTLTPVSVKV